MYSQNILKKSSFHTCIIILTLMTGFMNQAMADLLITPTRIQFSERDRSAKVSLVNTSNQTRTYKIFWDEKYQKLDGQYVSFKIGEREFPSASKMIRYSPRQVTLKAGERQHVRLGLRRPKDLNNGEYRSHLVFQAQPIKTSNRNEKKTGIQLNLNLSFSIPIIVREGSIDVSSSISKVDLVTRRHDGKNYTGAHIDIERQGKFSTLGNMKIYWKDTAAQPERLIGIKNNVSIYPERATRKISFWFKDHPQSSGIMRIVYEGAGEFKGQLFSQKTVNVNALNYRLEEKFNK
jgi:fimbrial chaperone protein